MKKLLSIIIIFAAALILLSSCSQISTILENSDISSAQLPAEAGSTAEFAPATDPDDIIRQLFDEQKSGVQVTDTGTVTKVLADDTSGSRHQRFILRLESGQTLLVAHNVDIAPRLEGLSVGDTVEFKGEYYYDDQGGGVHWTHRDPDGVHADGYLKWNGKIYQ